MKKILLIDDDEALRTDISEILQLSDFIVIEASNGKSGVEKALREKPDLILCDVSMPQLDGYGVLHVLGRHPETFHIPFIFLTGHQDMKELRKGMGMGADDYIMKPVSEDELLNSIEIRLKKVEALRKNVLPTTDGFYDFIQHASQVGVLDLVTEKRDTYHYKKKHILYSVDQKPQNVYFVSSGRLKEFVINADGKEFITNIYTKGDFFGYINILEDINYTESVQVLDDASLVVIPRSDFLKLINTEKQIASQFISLLSHNVRSKEMKLVNLAYNSLRKKVAVGIIEIMDKFNEVRDGKPVVEISREDLASLIGSAQESMIRTLKEFKNEKLIDVVDGRIYVLDEQKLRHLLY